MTIKGPFGDIETGRREVRSSLESGHLSEIAVCQRRADTKVVRLRIFAKNPKREAIADSYNLSRATEVAYEFSVGR